MKTEPAYSKEFVDSLLKACVDYRSQVDQLERENTALRKDKERMDWLDEVMSYDGGGYGMKWWFFTPIDAEDVRAAIDAAMKEAQP
jgi:hypothetical protein